MESNCGGEGVIPPSPEAMQAFAGYANSSYPIPDEKEIESLYYPADWLKANPNHQGLMPAPKEPISPEVLQAQFKAAANWNGTCNDLSNITHPTLVIVGTEDLFASPANSIMLVDRIPSAWLVQIRNSGHGLMYQYPDEFSRIVLTFLGTVR